MADMKDQWLAAYTRRLNIAPQRRLDFMAVQQHEQRLSQESAQKRFLICD